MPVRKYRNFVIFVQHLIYAYRVEALQKPIKYQPNGNEEKEAKYKEKDPNPINKFDFMKRKCFFHIEKRRQPNNEQRANGRL